MAQESARPDILAFQQLGIEVVVDVPLVSVSQRAATALTCDAFTVSASRLLGACTKEGAFANVSIGTLQKQVQITSLTKNEITLKTERLRLIVNRQTSSIQVYEDNFYERVECLVDKFKM